MGVQSGLVCELLSTDLHEPVELQVVLLKKKKRMKIMVLLISISISDGPF